MRLHHLIKYQARNSFKQKQKCYFSQLNRCYWYNITKECLDKRNSTLEQE